MSAIQLPSEKEIRAAYQEGEEAVILLFQTTFLVLAERIQKLEDQLAKNSRNSGKPPSSDGYDQPAPKSLRKRSRRRSGGQKGHTGETLKMAEKARPCPHPSRGSLYALRSLHEAAESGTSRKAAGLRCAADED